MCLTRRAPAAVHCYCGTAQSHSEGSMLVLQPLGYRLLAYSLQSSRALVVVHVHELSSLLCCAEHTSSVRGAREVALANVYAH
jgi:hypothetical protein